jgi:hypothetical protein
MKWQHQYTKFNQRNYILDFNPIWEATVSTYQKEKQQFLKMDTPHFNHKSLLYEN